jgi:hypothetical protein
MSYSGITVLLNRPSRFDEQSNRLISGKAGESFDKQFAKYGIDRKDLVIKTAYGWNTLGNRMLLDDTKAILCLGYESLKLFNTENNIGEMRGSPFLYQGIPVITSFAPQDANDLKDYESSYHEGGDEDEDPNDKTFNKGHGVTARRNFKFWLNRDIAKTIRIAREGLNLPEFTPLIYPDIDDICRTLLLYRDCYLHIDIETDPETIDITVFSFCYESISGDIITPVYTVPLRRFNYTCAYEQPWKIWQALAVAMARNIVVTHNGHQYDLFVFTYKYRMPFSKRNFDTIIGQHRNFPEVEKSLGHCISLYTDFPFHKNDGIFCPQNREQEMKLWNYNAKDVFTMIYVRQGIEKYAKLIGSWEGIQEANDYIVWTLTETFTGIRRDTDAVNVLIQNNEKRIKQLYRILNALVGQNYNPKFHADDNPIYLNVRSPKQMQQYLFNKKTEGGLGLQPYEYGVVSKKTGIAAPKADEKTLLRLQVKHGIASIAVVLELRRLAKQTSSLEINHWNPYGKCADVSIVDDKEIEEKEEAA